MEEQTTRNKVNEEEKGKGFLKCKVLNCQKNFVQKMHQSIQDWRQAVRMPTAYRVGNSTLRIQTQFIVGVAIVGVSFLILLYALLPYTRNQQLVSDLYRHDEHGHQHGIEVKRYPWTYNFTYPLTRPSTTPKGLRYRIAVISDLDVDSKDKQKNFTWFSYLKKGYLTIDITKKYVNIEWDPDIITLRSTLSQGGRGMELSELVVFNGKLLAFDDRTGVIYEISENSAIPWILLTDGNGKTAKGYMIHEAAVWSDVHQQWFFLPRRASFITYNDKDDEKKGTNMLLKANEDFTQLSVTNVGPLIPTHGFSSFKFVPDTSDSVIIALKTEENEGHIATFITVFTINGEIWLPEKEIGSYKFEGIEFI
ncbi:soluble calcium-activated nucleotidase 1 [Trichonephila inaurata madagascariensis]|uniref:Soluble calcium-activated nucleotidase 1 n=1 Tax=Trichonephila inaurata madagascariensis TaxID=2747483 RepID=A0A8X6Y215_9ARAC|nr:soluble calcium-activated nucleotidase 1 [Trichonephila inaurata madagascariensis]